MSLLTKGIRKLSELQIDTDKDWEGKGIFNLKEVAAAMGHGDIAFKATSTPALVKLPPLYGVGAHYLHSKSIGGGKFQPEWEDIQELVAYITGGVNRSITPPVLALPAPGMAFEATEDHSGGGFTVIPGLSVPEPAVSLVTAKADPLPVDGGVSHDEDVGDVDEKAACNDDTTNDIHLLPATLAILDGFYFGLSSPFDWVAVLIGTAGVGTWTIAWKYWNGTAWADLTMIYDQTDHWRTTGKKWANWTRPSDWATTTILGYDLYWAKAECTSVTTYTTQPLGTRAWTGRFV